MEEDREFWGGEHDDPMEKLLESTMFYVLVWAVAYVFIAVILSAVLLGLVLLIEVVF